MQTELLQGGFADPVLEAQSVFRALMAAMAEPGTVQTFSAEMAPPPALPSALAAIACTLCDTDTPVWLDAPLATDKAVRGWLAFHTNAPLAADPALAQFALVADPAGLSPLPDFAIGDDAYPDRSATLVLACSGFREGNAVDLTGPGIEDRRRFGLPAMPAGFRDWWERNGALFPRGVDLFLAAPEGVAALPRTTRICWRED
ncbi:MAG: phosphonate C-P lyase system protein PhnH [Minwuia sp.]|uniref:phosphonate C-P lyase system protein PhnH n=1 Tax=Minwuia sp. TaxID=2493630 RepID=UPI003A86E967